LSRGEKDKRDDVRLDSSFRNRLDFVGKNQPDREPPGLHPRRSRMAYCEDGQKASFHNERIRSPGQAAMGSR